MKYLEMSGPKMLFSLFYTLNSNKKNTLEEFSGEEIILIERMVYCLC